MKLVILTEGGRGRGFGHIARCLSFYQGFEEKGLRANLIVDGDDTVKNLLKGKRYRIFDWLEDQKDLFEEIEGADVAVVDSYLANRELYQEVSKRVGCGVYLDDTQRLDYPEGIVINGALGAEKLRYPKKEGVTYLLGIKYTPLRKEFVMVPQKRIRRKVKTMMITFGGNDGGLTARIVNYLNTTCPGIRKEVVVGRGFRNVADIKKLRESFTTLVYSPDAQGMKKVMLDADLAISGGGQTLYELARIGVPTIAISFAENQLINIKGWQKAGFISYAGWYRDKGLLEKLKRGVDHLLPYEVRVKRSKAGRAAIDGKGVDRAVDWVLDSLKKERQLHLREVNKQDCYDLWIWRNHPEVRRWSFDKQKVNYRRHVEWFRRMAESKDCTIYVAENDKQKKIGQVRFQMDKDDRAWVSINLNPDFMKRGLGNKILAEATLKYLRQNPRVVEIRAEILGGNAASRKTFQKAGYHFCQHVFKADQLAVLYKYTRD